LSRSTSPYEVQLAQAEGQLAKDQAALDNGKLDLARYQKLWSQNAIPAADGYTAIARHPV
jgi:multidrug efflux system membrane fusion protein